MLSFKSRYDTKRTLMLDKFNEQVEYVAYNTLWYNCNGPYDHIQSIDPDGGPYFEVGQKLSFDNDMYRIISIHDVSFKNETMKAVFNIKKDNK